MSRFVVKVSNCAGGFLYIRLYFFSQSFFNQFHVSQLDKLDKTSKIIHSWIPFRNYNQKRNFYVGIQIC